jgi:hypothetical protein
MQVGQKYGEKWIMFHFSRVHVCLDGNQLINLALCCNFFVLIQLSDFALNRNRPCKAAYVLSEEVLNDSFLPFLQCRKNVFSLLSFFLRPFLPVFSKTLRSSTKNWSEEGKSPSKKQKQKKPLRFVEKIRQISYCDLIWFELRMSYTILI